MAFTEDLNSFLADFGVDATFGAETAKVILDQPDDVIAGGSVISASYTILYKTGTFSGLGFGDVITVAGDSFEVDTVQRQADGAFTLANVNKQ